MAADDDPDRLPTGGLYEWFRRGLELLDSGNAAAAAQLLTRAVEHDPQSRSLREALGRAQFDAHDFAAARDSFARIVEADPTDDYAQFGYGLAATRLGELDQAVVHLALAVAMRPELVHYARALRQARAQLATR
ncbi:MAG TPA: tetratricopeptide repeat protein [Mycobacteriales bacterium]|nr:tetratricopeptide repeat protein [Mycobacteriales bacterium]